ncbi:phage tail tape measure protein [Moraxella porci]|uniref:phage tail tape measure protein n=1 Tax=Moraxella porci TaxID=1288392 RepID=UPI0024492CFF|nr:phage tail tape measure protein [Moraxella porci]MDH2272998.1 phage tail tape measure protein [Moraxella porci]
MSTVSKLQIVLEATTTAFDRGLRKAQDGLNAFAKQTDKIHAKMESFQKRHQGAFDAMQAIGAASAVGLVAIGAGIKATTAEAMKFESAMAEVKKVVNFESPDGIKQMRAELEELSTRVPIAFDGLAKIAAAAGQSGIAANEIVKFTEAAAKMGTAFDITAEQAGQAMAEMRTAFKMSQAEVETLADKINYLGNNSPNAAAKIMEVVQRIGPLGEIAGVSADQIAAMAASLTSVEPDVAATGLKNMMLQLVKGESLSKSAKAAFDDLGLSYTEIAKGMQTDSIGTINKVFEAIKKLPEEAQAAKINDIFGSESIAVISQLINGTDTLGKHLQAMGDASKYAGSMSQEAANINDTSAAKMDRFKHAIQNAKAAIGDAFLPALGALAEALLPVINGIKQFAQENPTMVTAITGIVGGVLVLGTALGAIGLAVPLVTTALGGLTAVAGLVGAAIGAISLPVVAVVAAIAALVAAGVALYKNWDTIKAKAVEVFNGLPQPVRTAIENIKSFFEGLGKFIEQSLQVIIPMAGAVWHSFSTLPIAAFESIKAIVSGSMASIGALIKAGVTVAASVFNAGFEMIKNVVSTVFSAIKAIARGDMEGFKEAISSGAKRAYASIKGMASDIKQALIQLGRDLLQAGRDAVQGFINGMNEKIGAAVAKAKELASRAKGAVTGFLDINSPSRVMKQIGEWVSEGLAIGIAAKAPLAAKEAKKAAEAVKKAFDDELANLERSILVNTLKLKGDPNAEFTADVVSGKYGDAKNLDKLYQTKQQALNIEQQVKAMESFSSTIAGLHRQIALMGNDDPTKELLYDFENTNKYVGYTVEQMQELESQLIALGKAKVNADFADELKKSTDELNKQQFLLNNIGDKYAELTYSLAQKGFDTSQIEHIVSNTQQSDTMAQFRQWDAKNRENTNPLAKLQADLDAEMALITSFHEQKLLGEQEYLQRKFDLEAQFDAQSQALKIAGYESQLALASGLAKDLLGESSRGYKAIFAMEKGMAIARVLMDNKVALAKAWASAPFPQNLPAVGTTLVKTGALAAAVNAIRPVIGQAHDGIMSVPKSGTWNLEKGERVLPKHTAKALDDKLDGMGSGGTVNNINVNVSVDSNGGDVSSDYAFGKRLGDAIRTTVQQELMREKRQGGALYGI